MYAWELEYSESATTAAVNESDDPFTDIIGGIIVCQCGIR